MGDIDVTVRLNGEKEMPERLAQFMDDRGVDNRSDAVRAALDEGLRSMGYQPSFTERSERFLSLVRGAGSVLGLTALMLIGLGMALPRFSPFGLGLGMASIAFMAGAEIADRHGHAILTFLRKALRNELQNWTASGEG